MAGADNKTTRDANGNTYTLRLVNLAGLPGGSGPDLYGLLVPVVTMVPTVLTSGHTLAVGTTAVSLSSITGGIPSGATHALMSVPAGGGNITYTEDGATTPTSTIGILVPAGDVAELTNLANIQLIASAGTIAVYFSFRHY